ncbi:MULTISPECIES: GlsB/YeaQ/YmgE family stress response membrane protein [Acidiphilium]|jgi:uncharacterized membrane protein YeaQ/YmgE (transglycosylase-associated protein family)|uniref:Transglycosylase-associated protein n=2 Tax=Acidiphilium TaxID=522 RepID=A5FUR9_ACICJ|nr:MULTISPECIES: GlsB/YeaQ/YmgE family stress response membrane protein [Acidiphilium]MBU6356296.1 GlsB/YeaQ/YmgE family stress response membrane protein [Rhodospirillales bacterium]ABQ29351.1 Transglycosylase-associated protein [Acidiphilium cryptum JF-5]EGO93713.1 Transglycosylase-associated protein [Acidiphilium sp. PM]KDM67266.1 hypothetical protein ACIDI_40c00170 [Acidiphilium sp. JA12-A1]MBS3023687.1 GlsB/YeaQ/YmgE family stress response membrane protein [Acidiphilium multivorum]
MHLIGFIILGLIAGWIASQIVDNGGKGPILDIVLGIVGALVGGQIFLALGFAPGGGFLYSLFVSVVGAVIILVAYHALLGRRRL